DELLLDRARQPAPYLAGRIGAVEQEGGARGGELQDVEALQEVELVTGDEIRRVDEVRRMDGPRTEAQVRNRLGARLMRIVDEVALRMEPCSLSDDLDAVLVGPHRAIRAQAIEDRANHVVRLDGKTRVECETGVLHIVDDAHGEA